ncbi:hypothetical protein L7F22_013010 [Adiantum nelumboides]|nr:hypothetical protein [Adiantum nelumboides]
MTKQEMFVKHGNTRPIVKPVTFKFDQPVPKYMLAEAQTHPHVHSPMKSTKEDSNTVVLTAGDVNRIKNSSLILTEADIARRRKEQYDERMRNSAIATQRKAMMLKMEADRKRKVGALTETERLRKEKDALILENAHKKWEDEIDQVKKMNSMVLYAKTATARDGQKHEKIDKLEEEKNYNEKMHGIMMMKAQKEEELEQAREANRAKARLDGAQTLREQIAEAEEQRRIAEEMKELEGKRMLQEIERQRLEDLRAAQKKYVAGQQLYAEIMKFNEDQIQHKKHLAELEKEETEKINLYVYMKDLKEQQYQEELNRQRRFKEMETARLRAMQEKAQDKQAQLDELRAQRVQEALEREWRMKEKAETERLKRMNEEIAKAREDQKLLKMKRLADQAKHEQAEFYRVIREQQEAVRLLKEEEDKVRIRNHQNRDEILRQIQKHKEERERERKAELEYGEKIRLRSKAELEILESIKQRKLKELQKEGVPEKYQAELARKKVTSV